MAPKKHSGKKKVRSSNEGDKNSNAGDNVQSGNASDNVQSGNASDNVQSGNASDNVQSGNAGDKNVQRKHGGKKKVQSSNEGDKNSNASDNVQSGNASDNVQSGNAGDKNVQRKHGGKKKVQSSSKGDSKVVKKITIELKKEIIEKHDRGIRVTDLASEYKMAKSTISTILKNKAAIKGADVAKGVTMLTKQRTQVLEEVEKLLLVWLNEKQLAGAFF
ncbi:uncharacterized PPE family protein PPE13-like [Bufo bufo]|uniref:uncharacterized PPE family protein PPE13-like n=1 Tax=Bufo bufo TaxID=8384 RepID=UPI001ABDFD9A|nr:uncharacterized PPE family protein PPE13-like [Bufo bufo]